MSSAHIEALESLIKQRGGPANPELRIALARLSGELRERASKGSASSYDFFANVVNTLAKVKGNTLADLRLACLYECGTFFYRSGFASAALHTSGLMEKLATRAENKSWVSKASTLSGVVHSEVGNVADAMIRHVAAVSAAREIGDRDAETMALINLATALNYGGLHYEAIRCLNRAVALTTHRNYRAIAYCDLAQAYLALEEYSRGFDCISRCLEISEEPANAGGFFGRTIREFTYVQLALETGKLARAREHAVLCWQYSRWGNNSRCRTLAEIATGLCEIHGGNVDKGLVNLQTALVTSGEFVVSRIDALSALAKAYDDVGQPEEALRYLGQLTAFVRTARAQSMTALLQIPLDLEADLVTLGNIRALELREAQLKAKVAEREILNTRLEMLERLAIAADLKEEPSGQHGFRVGRLTQLLAKRLGFSSDAITALEVGARLHDIGKIGLPDRVLLTSETLREAQRHLVSTHTTIGSEILSNSKIHHVQVAEEIARHHHEWWDGTGYPSKLSGKRIPIHARIVALADVFDALTHGRPYSPPWPIERALEEIRAKRGTQFDPDLTDTFLALIGELRRDHADLDAYLGEAGRNSPFLQAREKIRLMLEGERQAENMAAAAAETVH